MLLCDGEEKLSVFRMSQQLRHSIHFNPLGLRVLGVNGRYDLEKRVSDRENGVRQAEVGDSRVAVRLAKREVPAKPLDGLLQVSRREDRLSKPRHAAPTYLAAGPRGNLSQGTTWRQIEPRARMWR